MAEKPRFERPTTTEEEHELVLKRSEYLLQHIADQEQQITTDHLTGLKTRKVLEDELEQSLKMIRGELLEQREKPLTELSIIAIDIDDFKAINDGLGHAAGDDVLRNIGALLLKSVRRTDTVARVGGEELMVLMPGADLGSAEREAQELRMKVEQLAFSTYPELHITASFGVVSSKSSTDPETLKELADRALYRAKGRGRNRVEIEVNI